MNKKNKKEEIVENKEEIQDDEPSWYHYVIILFAFFGIFFLISFLFETYDTNSDNEIIDVVNTTEAIKYTYEYNLGNVTYNVELALPLKDLNKYDFLIEPTKLDFLNTVDFKFNTMNYGEDNAYVSVSAIKLRRTLSTIFFFNFEAEDFYTTNQTSCTDSNLDNRIITFDINSSFNSSVLQEDNGCIRVIANNAKEMPILIDYFIVSILEN